MKKIISWFERQRIKRRLNEARRFMMDNCLARINRGQLYDASESAIYDWEAIQNAINDSYAISMTPSREASSPHRSEDRQPG